MKIFNTIPVPKELSTIKTTEEMVLYEPFLLQNAKTKSNDFPDSDELYYTALEYQLQHLLYKHFKGWITSERQIIYTSDECVSVVHFIFNDDMDVHTINVFQRSSNLNNLEDDVQFFNHFISKHLSEYVKINIFVSAPHTFIGKTKKIED